MVVVVQLDNVKKGRWEGERERERDLYFVSGSFSFLGFCFSRKKCMTTIICENMIHLLLSIFLHWDCCLLSFFIFFFLAIFFFCLMHYFHTSSSSLNPLFSLFICILHYTRHKVDLQSMWTQVSATNRSR